MERASVPRRALIVSADIGEGHNAAGRALEEAIARVWPGCRVGWLDALAAVKRKPPDLVLLDVMMPGLDGFAVGTQLKSAQATRLIPVVMITALTAREDRLRGIALGVDDFL